MYSQEITRRHRAAFVIALDLSGSMQERVRMGRMSLSKAEALSYTASMLLSELIDRCRRTDSLRNYYDIAVLGYHNNRVESLLAEQGFIPITHLAERMPQPEKLAFEETLPDGSQKMVEHTLVRWFEPTAEGNTPMYEAMLRVRDLVEEWTLKEQNRESFPPVVINITDGEPSDCDSSELYDICSQIRRTSTKDGNTLLLNIHITTDMTLPSVVFPTSEELSRAGNNARTLAECSSIMPTPFHAAIRAMKSAGTPPPYYGMGYNASIIELLSIINIGSRSVTNMQ